jgi:hypothetical protein
VVGYRDFTVLSVGLEKMFDCMVDVLYGVNIFTIDRSDRAVSETASPGLEFSSLRSSFA